MKDFRGVLGNGGTSLGMRDEAAPLDKPQIFSRLRSTWVTNREVVEKRVRRDEVQAVRASMQQSRSSRQFQGKG